MAGCSKSKSKFGLVVNRSTSFERNGSQNSSQKAAKAQAKLKVVLALNKNMAKEHALLKLENRNLKSQVTKLYATELECTQLRRVAKEHALLKLENQNLKSQLTKLYATELECTQLRQQLLVIKPLMNTVSQSLLQSVDQHCNAMSIIDKIKMEPTIIKLQSNHQNPQLEVGANDPKPKLFHRQPMRKSCFQKINTIEETVSQAAAALSSNADFFSSKNSVPIDEDMTEIYDVSLFKATTMPLGKTVPNVPKEGQTSLAFKDALQNQTCHLTPNPLQQHLSSATTALADNSKATPTETTNHEAWDMELTLTIENTIVESDKNKKQALSGSDVGKINPKEKVTSTRLSTEKLIPQESLLTTKELAPELSKEPIPKTNPPLTTKEPMPELRKESLPKTNTPLTRKLARKSLGKKQPRKSPPERSVSKSKLLSDTEDESVYEPPKAAAKHKPKTTPTTEVMKFKFYVSKNARTAPKSKTLKASSSTKGAAAKKNTKIQLQTTVEKDANRTLDEFDLSNSIKNSSSIKSFSPTPRKSETISKKKMIFDTSSDSTGNDKTLAHGSKRMKTTTVKRLKKKSANPMIETDTDSQEDDMVSETNTVVQMKSRPRIVTAGSGKSTVKRHKESVADKLQPRTTSTKTTAVGRKPKEVKKCEEPQATTSTAIDGNVVRESGNFKVPAKNIGVRTKPKPKDQGKENRQSEVLTASDTTSGRKTSISGSKTTPLTNNDNNIKGITRKLRSTDVIVPHKKK